MKRGFLMSAVLAGIVVAAGAAQAQGGMAQLDFAELDLNGDGMLSMDELQAMAETRFAAIDADGDGGLSQEELLAAANRAAGDRAANMIARFDANGDGLLQIDEMPRRGGERGARMFSRLDADSDGMISEAEFASAMERMGRHDGKRGHRQGDRG